MSSRDEDVVLAVGRVFKSVLKEAVAAALAMDVDVAAVNADKSADKSNETTASAVTGEPSSTAVIDKVPATTTTASMSTIDASAISFEDFSRPGETIWIL